MISASKAIWIVLSGKARSYSVKEEQLHWKKLTNKRKNVENIKGLIVKRFLNFHGDVCLDPPEILAKMQTLDSAGPEKSPWFYISNKIPLRQQYCAPSQDLTSRMKEPEHRFSACPQSHNPQRTSASAQEHFLKHTQGLQVPKTG